jgi:spore coat assembly protein
MEGCMVSKIKINDYVKRKSYGGDVKFKVIHISQNQDKAQCLLKGMNVRLMADCTIDDLELLQPEEILEERHNNILLTRQVLKRIEEDRNKRINFLRNNGVMQYYYQIPGKVLHLDGDEDYLEKCINAYKMLDVPVFGMYVREKELPEKAIDLIKAYSPDIVVLTGHDALKKNIQDYEDISSYKTSKYFVDAVRNIRSLEPSRDSLVIIAGACQSYYEALIDAGANFATSPKRVLVHAFDPVYIAEKIAFTSIYQKVNLEEAVGNTITGKDGIGGVDTWGHYRVGFPKSNY